MPGRPRSPSTTARNQPATESSSTATTTPATSCGLTTTSPGFVDLVSSCAGPPEEDVAHCRANLAIHHGQGQADHFLQLWQIVTGRREYDPYFDLTGIVSFTVTEPDPAPDEFVATAAARIR